jgi:hypothetical protein
MLGTPVPSDPPRSPYLLILEHRCIDAVQPYQVKSRKTLSFPPSLAPLLTSATVSPGGREQSRRTKNNLGLQGRSSSSPGVRLFARLPNPREEGRKEGYSVTDARSGYGGGCGTADRIRRANVGLGRALVGGKTRRKGKQRAVREVTVEGAGLRCCDELENSVQGALVLLESELSDPLFSSTDPRSLPLGLPRTTNSNYRCCRFPWPLSDTV